MIVPKEAAYTGSISSGDCGLVTIVGSVALGDLVMY